MWKKQIASPLSFIGFLSVWSPLGSTAAAAPPVASDLTDFIARVGGYLYTTSGDDTKEHYWVQVSYKTIAPTSSPNITTITMTKFNPAAVYGTTGNGVPPTSSPAALTATSTNPASLNLCAAANYVVETVTLDLRDLQAKTSEAQASEGTHQIWSVTLQTNGDNLIRKNKQTLPANCPPSGIKPDSAMEQQDVSQYAIFFTYKSQADHFQNLVRNTIPNLSPPTLVQTTPGQ
jgi:hypothetical protein